MATLDRDHALARCALGALIMLWAGVLIGVSFLAAPAKFAKSQRSYRPTSPVRCSFIPVLQPFASLTHRLYIHGAALPSAGPPLPENPQTSHRKIHRHVGGTDQTLAVPAAAG